MTGFTGTLAFGSNSITLAGTGTIYTGDTTYSVTGTPLMLCTSSVTANRAVSCGAVTEANSISFNVTAGPNAFAISGSYKNLTFSGTFTGSLSNNVKTMYGNLTFKTGMTISAGASGITFAATSGTQTITSAALNLDFPITFAGTATYQLVDAMTVGSTRTVTFTSGTLDLNNKTLTTGIFNSNNSNTRSILFGTGNITCSGTGTVWTTSTITNFSYTGTPTVNLTDSSSTLRGITQGAGTAAQAVNFYIKAGTGQVSLFTTNGVFKDIDCTGSTVSLSVGSSIALYGNLILTNNTQASTFTLTIAGTSGTQTITSNGFTIDNPVTINGVGGTLQLVDALTLGSTRTLTLTNGTFNSNAKSVTAGSISANNSNTKTYTITNSTITVTGSSYFIGTTGTTFNLTGSNVVFTTSGSATFFSGNFAVTNPQVTMSGTGQLIIGAISATSVITTLTNTVQPCTVSLLSTMSQLTVTNFNLSGTAGNLVTFNSSVAGTARTLAKSTGTVTAQYLKIQDSTATGGATWIANPAINGGNNTGWVFSGPAIASRLTNTGILYANGQFDEVTQTTISTTYLTLYSAQFDEVTLNGQPGPQRRESSTGVVQVNGYFDETGGPLT
jgi:hypothetical protein